MVADGDDPGDEPEYDPASLRLVTVRIMLAAVPDHCYVMPSCLFCMWLTTSAASDVIPTSLNYNYDPFSDSSFHLRHFQTEVFSARSEKNLADMYFPMLLDAPQDQV